MLESTGPVSGCERWSWTSTFAVGRYHAAGVQVAPPRQLASHLSCRLPPLLVCPTGHASMSEVWYQPSAWLTRYVDVSAPGRRPPQ